MQDEALHGHGGGWVRTSTLLNAIGTGIGAYVAILVLLCSLGGMVSNSPFATLLLPLLALPSFFLVWHITEAFPGWVCGSKRVFVTMQVASFLLMLGCSLFLVPSLGWDWGQLIRSAREYVLEGSVANRTYYARYPNNLTWLSVLITYFKLIKTLYPPATAQILTGASVLLATLLVQATIVVIRLIITRLYGCRVGFNVWLVCLVYPPFICYAPFAYTDTPGMLLCALLILCYVAIKERAKEPESFLCVRTMLIVACLGMLAGVAVKVKVMVFIVVIAMVIDAILNCKKVKDLLCTVAVFAVFLNLTLALVSVFSQSFIRITEFESERYEFPPIHWVMMSLEYGGYWQEDVDYTMSFLTYDERVKADRELLDQRIKERGALGTFEFLTVTKAVRTWGESCLAGDDYVGRKTRHPDSLLIRFLTQEGDLNDYAQPYYWLTHLTLLLGVAFSMFSGMKNPRDGGIAFARFAFIGIYLFFTIWECNSRYLFPFVPLLIVCAVDGWRAFARMLRSWRELKEQRIEGGLVEG